MLSNSEVVNITTLRYNNLGVIGVIVAREHVKALVDRLSDEQVKALWIFLNAMVWPEVEISSVEIIAIRPREHASD
ncbi:Hypothetical protein DEACI_3290 [Acididesulfobacillus acetoxydans]|uniref:Uncharacterized protein n=1 Tax=Acididesulfobacillus acetoxydans TaxID=1561005 RepID=A0A8S0X0J1_9FIRM|nr:Hypothetical protein DEACI_3290 [Acididesulfobacillus acetoxydans]CEJ07242.1 Hypothetical protein DEACI_1703 [Acididesulfobacillus acetoxydans]